MRSLAPDLAWVVAGVEEVMGWGLPEWMRGHGLGAEDAWIAGLRFGFGVAGMICELYGG
uniref:Uncharacterized protein n=1 Tax=Fagus sylvatica TaxID=28930 RepID=A0A2N9F0L9_FAGSY